MRKTGFYAEYELFDTTARADSNPQTQTNQEFGDILKIKDETIFPDYATLEHNYFVLDGTMPEMPDSPENIAYFSGFCSGSNGDFSTDFYAVYTGEIYAGEAIGVME